MNNNLSYVVTLTAQKTSAIQEVMTSLQELKLFVEQGAEFDIRLGGDAIKNLKKQVRDSIRETLMQLEAEGFGRGGGGGRPSRTPAPAAPLSGSLDDGITALGAAVRELTRILQAGPDLGGGGTRRRGVPGSNQFFKAGSDLTSVYNTVSRGDMPSMGDVKRVVDGVEKATRKLKDVETGKIQPLLEQVRQLIARERPTSSAAAASGYDLQLKEAIERLFREQQSVMISVMSRKAGSGQPMGDGGSIDYVKLGREIARGIREGLGTASGAQTQALLNDAPLDMRGSPVTDAEASSLEASLARNRRAQLLAMRAESSAQLVAARRSGQDAEVQANEKRLAMLESALRDTGGEASFGFGTTARTHASRVMGRRDSVAAKALAQGQNWYDTLAAMDRNFVADAAREDFVALPGVDQRAVRRMLTQMQSAPLAMFAKDDNPAQAQRQFAAELQRELVRMDMYLENNASEAGAVLPPIAADRMHALLREVRNVDRRRAIGSAPHETDDAVVQSLESLDWLYQFDVDSPTGAYRALQGPRNFYAGHGRARPSGNRQFTDPANRPMFGDSDLFSWTPVTLLRDLRENRIDENTYNERREAMNEWARMNGLRFYEQTADREYGAVQKLREAEQQYNRLTSRENNYGMYDQDAVQSWDTRRRLFSQELMQGGTWGMDNDPFIQKRGRIVGGFAQLLTNKQLEAYAGPLQTGQMTLTDGVFQRVTGNYRGAGYWSAVDKNAGGGFGGEPPVAGGSPFGNVPDGQAIPVRVVNFSDMGAVNLTEGTDNMLGQVMTSLKNTAEMLRKAAIMDAPSTQKVAKLRGELDARLVYNEQLGEIDNNNLRSRLGIKREERERRAREAARALFDRVQQLQAQNGYASLDLLRDGPATGVEASEYVSDQGLFIRDLRGSLGTYRRANQRGAAGMFDRANAYTPQDSLRAEQRISRAGMESELAQIQLAQLLLTRAGPNGDAAIQANATSIRGFLQAAQEATGIRQIAGVAAQGQSVQEGLTTDLALKLGQVQAYASARNRVTQLERDQKVQAQYSELGYYSEQQANERDRLRADYTAVKDLPDRLRLALSQATSKGDARRLVSRILGETNDPRLEITDNAQLEGLLKPTKSQEKAGVEFSSASVMQFINSIVSGREKAYISSGTELTATLNQMTALRNSNPDAVAGDKYERDKQLKEARRQMAAVFNVSDPAEQARAFQQAKQDVVQLRTNLKAVSEETLKRVMDLAKSLGVTFTSVDDLVNGKLPEVEERLRVLGKVVVRTANAETRAAGTRGEGGGGTMGLLQSLARKTLQLGQYVAAGGFVYGSVNAMRATLNEVIGFEAEMRRIQGVLESGSPVQRQQIGQAVQGSALEYGTDLTQSLRAARIYAQIGASPEEISGLTRATLAAQQGAGFEGAQASEFLIAARTISDGNVLPFDILDRVAAIEARYAVTSQDLAQAVQRVGSLVNQFQSESLGGVDAFDTILGATTAIVEATRVSGNQAATALRFVLSRLASPDVASQLQREFGIKLAGEGPNELRPLQDILYDIAAKYESLQSSGNTVDASRLLVTFAGARQANIAAALLGNFNRVQSISSESAFSYGDSQRRAELQLDTVTGRLQQVNTSFFALVNNITEATGSLSAFKWILKQIAEGTGWLTQNAGPGALLGGGLVAGLALRRAGQAGTAALTARAVTPLTQLGTLLTGTITKFGIATAAVAGIAGAVQGYRYLADNYNWAPRLGGLLPGSRFRVRDLDTESAEAQYGDQLSELSERFGTSRSQLISVASAANRNLRGDFEARYGEGSYDKLLRGELVDTQVTNTVNKSILETFEKSIPGFAQMGTETERLNMAFAALRLNTAGLNISVSAMSKELTRISDEYGRVMGTSRERSADLRGDLQMSTLAEALERIDKLGQAPGLGFNPNLSNMMLYGGSIAERMRRRGYVDGSARFDATQGISEALSGAFSASQASTNTYWTEFNRLRDARLRQYAGRPLTAAEWRGATPSPQEVFMSLDSQTGDNRPAPIPAYERNALMNQRLIYDDAMDAVAERYPQLNLRRPDRPDDSLESAVSALDASRRRAFDDAIRFAAAAGQPIEAAQQEALARALLNPGQRESQLANLSAQTGAAARVRALYLQPYIQYMQQQSDITNMRELGQYGAGFDYQSARADASRNLVLNLGRVRGSLLNNTLQEVVQAGTQVRALTRADFANIDLEGLSANTRQMINNLPLVGEEGAGETNQRAVESTIRRLSANENMLELYTNNFKALFEQVEGMTPEQGAIAERMMASFKDMTEGAPDAEKLRNFLLDSLKFSNTAAEAIKKAQEQYAREQEEIYARENRRLDIVDRQNRAQLSIQLQAGRGQIGVEARAGAFASIGRQDLAYEAQQRSFDIRRGEAAALRAAELAILRENLANDPANLRVGSNEYNKRLREGTLALDNQYRTTVQQTNLEQERALVAEQLRRRDDINRQGQTLTDGVFAPVKTLLTDFDALSKRGIPVVVEGLAGTFQNLFAERAIDLLAGPNGFLTDGLRSVFTEGSFQTNYAINSAFITGGEAAATAIRAALNGATGTGVALPGLSINEAFSARGAGNVTTTMAADGSMVITGAAAAGVGGLAIGQALGDRATKYLTNPGILPAAQRLPRMSPEQIKRMTDRQRRLQGAIALGQLGGSIGGAFLGQAVNPGEETYASEGASIGTALGSGIATLAGATGVGLVVAPLIGGLLGGLIGGGQKRGGRQDPQLAALERIERNTRQQIDAIENQTQLLTPDNRFLNVPAGFLVPGFRPAAAGSFGDINITVYGGTGQDPTALGDAVAKALTKELSTRGGGFDVRNL